MQQLDLFDELRRPTLREIWQQAAAGRPVARPNATVTPADVPRLKGALRRLYDHMKDGKWCDGPSLVAVAGLRFGGRLYELARAGIPFQKEHVREGIWRYRLVHSPTNGVGADSAPDV